MSPKSLTTSYTIAGCRDGLPVTKIVLITGTNCQSILFSDGGTETDPSLRTEGDCISSSVIGGKDFISISGNALSDEIGVNTVRSFTLVSLTDCPIVIEGDNKVLKAGYAYTWSQGDAATINVSSIIFVNDGIEVEAIRETI